ncbi:hypothetical protein MAR_019749, partial [Mya arenaria]
MTSFFIFGILLAVIRIECFQLLVQQLPNPAYDHDNVTLSASYSGFEIIEYPSYLEWVIVSSLQSVGLILLPGCEAMGFMNISAYSFSCSEGEFTWTILNVSRYEHGQIWSCTFTNTKGKSVHAELALKLQVSHLFIENPVNCDRWTCRVGFGFGNVLESNPLDMLLEGITTEVEVSSVQLIKPVEIEVRETEKSRVLFECVSDGLPAPTIRWFMDNKTPNNTDDEEELKLNSSSKPKALEINVTVDAKLHFVIDNVYPIPTELVVTVFSQKNSHADMSLASKTMKDIIIAFGIQTDTLEGGHTNSSNESLTLETSHMVQDSEPDINLTCTYTGNRTVYVVSWYRNRALVGAVCPSCAILIPPHFDRYQFICPSTFETVLSVEQLILNQTLDMWMCQVGFGFGDVLESSPVDILLKGLVTEGPEQPVSISEKVKLIGGVIGGFVTGLLVGIASVFLVHKMRLVGKCMAEKETTDIPAKLAAAHQQESLPYENDKEQDIKTNPSEGVVCYQNTMGTAGSDHFVWSCEHSLTVMRRKMNTLTAQIKVTGMIKAN